MSEQARRVVLTGLGGITPLGHDLPAMVLALATGRTGVRSLGPLAPGDVPAQVGGTAEGFDVRDYVDRKDRKLLKTMTRTVELAVAAARRALDDAGLSGTPGGLLADPQRVGVVFGAGTQPG